MPLNEDQKQRLRQLKQSEILNSILPKTMPNSPNAPVMSQEQKAKRIAELKAAQQSIQNDPLVSASTNVTAPDKRKPWYEDILNYGKEIGGMTFPGQLYHGYKQMQDIATESSTPGEVPPAVAAIRGIINSYTFGQAPKIAAGIESPFSEKTYPELKQQYQDYYQRSAQERPVSTGVGADIGSSLLMKTLGSIIPTAAISTKPANKMDMLKMGWDVLRGGGIGEAAGVGATYGVSPDQDIRLEDRLSSAYPTAIAGSASGVLPRVGSMIGRDRANKAYIESINEPRVAAFQTKKKEIESANLAEKQRYEMEKGKIPERKEQAKAVAELKKSQNLDNIDSQRVMVQQNRIKAWDDLMQDPSTQKSTVDLSKFWNEASKKYNEITSKVASNRTTDESNYVRQYEAWNKDFTNKYGVEGQPSLSKEGAYILGEKRPKQLQVNEIPFNEAIGMNKVINEEYGKEGFSSILSTLKNDLTKSIEGSANKNISEKFKRANSLYGYEKDLNRAYSQVEKKAAKGIVQPARKPQYQRMPDMPELEVAPKPEVPLGAQTFQDLISPTPNPGSTAESLRNLIGQIYYPSITPTPSQRYFEKSVPYLQLLGNAITSFMGSDIRRPTTPGDQI